MFYSLRAAAPQKALFFLTLGLLALLLLFPAAAADGVRRGMELAFHTLLPSLFPVLLCGEILFSLLFAAFPRLPRPAAILAAFLFGQFGGFVAGAKALSALRQRGALSERDASVLLCSCVNAGPAFLISAVGAGMFHSLPAGVCLWASLQLASLVCFLGSLPLLSGGRQSRKPVPAVAVSFGDSLAKSLRAVANLCGTAVAFCCLQDLLTAAFPAMPAVLREAAALLLEVGSGCAAAAESGGGKGLFLAAAAVSFSGLSVLMQLLLFCRPAGISLRFFLLSRLLHLPLALCFLRLMLGFLPKSVDAWVSASGAAVLPFCSSPEGALALFGLCCCLLGGRSAMRPLYDRGRKAV